MDHMETQAQAVERLRSDGFVADFELSEDGHLTIGDRRWDPSHVTIAELVRFEGMSDPDDEAMLLALVTPDEVRGTLVMPYGPAMTEAQVSAARHLLLDRRNRP